MPGFIGIHLGAGDHALRLTDEYQKLSNFACRKAMSLIKSGGSALDACVEAVIALEDSSLTNAGLGSNCTWDGQVECDASVMDGSSLQQGAVGAVSGVKNPVCLARHICIQRSKPLPMGLVPSSFLVGSGALAYAEKARIPTVPADNLVTSKQLRKYHKYRRKFDILEANNSEQDIPALMDTVGAVCMDNYGNVAAACSSGGGFLKQSGRVGQAGIPGVGCWAENSSSEYASVAASSSGCGEQLMSTFITKEAARMVQDHSCAVTGLQKVMLHKFMESPFIVNEEAKYGGLIVLKYDPHIKIGEFLWTHSTKTMCVGFMNCTDKNPKNRMSFHSRPGISCKVEGHSFQ